MEWNFFRRLLIGTIVEILRDHHVQADVAALESSFDRESAFQVPRLDNYMRFKGYVRARLLAPLRAGARDAVQADLNRVWPELLAAIKFPLGDRLDLEKNHVEVREEAGALYIGFDLTAD